MTTLLEKYRPKTLDEYIGGDRFKNMLPIWLENFEKGDKHILFYGPPGTGKTTFATLVGSDLDIYEVNASMERTTSFFRDIEEVSQFYDRLIIMDEADGLQKNQQRKLVKIMEKSPTPFIIICNDLSKIVSNLRALCHPSHFDYPPPFLLQDFAEKVLQSEEGSVDKDLIDEVGRYCKSYRDVINLITAGGVKGGNFYLTPMAAFEGMLRGDEEVKAPVSAYQLPTWIFDIVKDSSRARRLSVLSKRTWVVGQKYLYDMTGCIRSNNPVDYPYSYSLKNKVLSGKKKISEEEDSEPSILKLKANKPSKTFVIFDDKVDPMKKMIRNRNKFYVGGEVVGTIQGDLYVCIEEGQVDTRILDYLKSKTKVLRIQTEIKGTTFVNDIEDYIKFGATHISKEEETVGLLKNDWKAITIKKEENVDKFLDDVW